MQSGPTGEVASLAEANEIRVVFSEPMVTLGRIPARVTAPFFRVSPAMPGTFRWSGTTILIFTPDPKRPLPYATKYDVTIDADRDRGERPAARHGRTRFSFTTPTVKLLQTNWYRRGGRAGAPMVILLRFNQPVRRRTLRRTSRREFETHDWSPPALGRGGPARLKTDRSSRRCSAFIAKVGATRAVVESRRAGRASADDRLGQEAVSSRRRISSCFETTTDGAARGVGASRRVDGRFRRRRVRRSRRRRRAYTIKVEPAFFVNGFDCTVANARLTMATVSSSAAPVKASAFAAARPGGRRHRPRTSRFRSRRRSRRGRGRDYELDESSTLSLEDAGFDGSRRRAPTRSPSARRSESADGQTLGYTWVRLVENWHQRAFTSFGDGHGVWEKVGRRAAAVLRAQLPCGHAVGAARSSLQELMPTLLRLQENDDEFGRRGASTKCPHPGSAAPPRGDAGSDPVARPRPVEGAERRRHRAGVGGGPRRRSDRARASRIVPTSRRSAPSLVQVTNLGISVKDSPQNTLVFVTRLDNGAPVAGARVSIVERDNQAVWTGTTGADGVAIAPRTPPARPARLVALRVPRHGREGRRRRLRRQRLERRHHCRGTSACPSTSIRRSRCCAARCSRDRGVYRLGEEVHFKAILRTTRRRASGCCRPGRRCSLSVRDSQDRRRRRADASR